MPISLNQQKRVLISESNSANLSISILSISDFQLAKSSFLANCYVSTPAVIFNHILLHN